MSTDWPASLGRNTDRWTSEWVESNGQKRGQVFGGQRGLWYAVNSARHAAEYMRSDTITATDGRVVYDLAGGVDLLPDCPRCGHVCQDPSTHVPIEPAADLGDVASGRVPLPGGDR